MPISNSLPSPKINTREGRTARPTPSLSPHTTPRVKAPASTGPDNREVTTWRAQGSQTGLQNTRESTGTGCIDYSHLGVSIPSRHGAFRELHVNEREAGKQNKYYTFLTIVIIIKRRERNLTCAHSFCANKSRLCCSLTFNCPSFDGKGGGGGGGTSFVQANHPTVLNFQVHKLGDRCRSVPN